MGYSTIIKAPLAQHSVKPNLENYEEMCAAFEWEGASRELDWFDKAHINIAHAAIDAHLASERGNKPAMIWESRKGDRETYTFADLAQLSSRFADGLVNQLGAQKGDRVFFFLERVPEIFIGILGALKAGCVIGPLFSAFGPDAVKDRLLDSGARVLVTSPGLDKKVAAILPELPDLENVIHVNRGAKKPDRSKLDYEALMAGASDTFETVRTQKEDYAIMHYTSGTTGKPKGAAHVHEVVVGQYATAKYVLDLQENDIYWCTADPGWVTGTSTV